MQMGEAGEERMASCGNLEDVCKTRKLKVDATHPSEVAGLQPRNSECEILV